MLSKLEYVLPCPEEHISKWLSRFMRVYLYGEAAILRLGYVSREYSCNLLLPTRD